MSRYYKRDNPQWLAWKAEVAKAVASLQRTFTLDDICALAPPDPLGGRESIRNLLALWKNEGLLVKRGKGGRNLNLLLATPQFNKIACSPGEDLSPAPAQEQAYQQLRASMGLPKSPD